MQWGFLRFRFARLVLWEDQCWNTGLSYIEATLPSGKSSFELEPAELTVLCPLGRNLLITP